MQCVEQGGVVSDLYFTCLDIFRNFLKLATRKTIRKYYALVASDATVDYRFLGATSNVATPYDGVDLTGVEPVVSAMRMRRITSCATGPCKILYC